ncbi:unnamed protein product, partial [Brassica rapa subsp. narinosa]
MVFQTLNFSYLVKMVVMILIISCLKRCTFLPKLKTLVTSRDLRCACKDKLEMLLPAFPVLEELYVKNILWKPWGDTVSSASLKKLSLHAEGCESMTVHVPTSMSISFDTPSLL